jgi:exonuclease III
MDELSKNISVLSYNIWFDKENKNERTVSLIENIRIINPDIVCFQEVTEDVLKYIKKKLTLYNIFPKTLDSAYGCVIISKYPISKTKIYKLTSNMNRTLLVAKIDVRFEFLEGDMIRAENKHLLISTCHYESEFNSVNLTKMAQFDEVKTILNRLSKQYSKIIHCADTNITGTEQTRYLTNDPEWKDAWIEMGSDASECHTYDCFTNDNLMKRKIKLRSRIDRTIYKSDGTLTCINFKMIKGVMDFIQPSDHHGILSVFHLENNDVYI